MNMYNCVEDHNVLGLWSLGGPNLYDEVRPEVI